MVNFMVNLMDNAKYKLVGGFNHLEKYEFVNGKDDNPYMTWKIKNVPNHQPVTVDIMATVMADIIAKITVDIMVKIMVS